jgi:asparagine synthase (glutamine-hydrolysing)
MCGIIGIYQFKTNTNSLYQEKIKDGLSTLSKRGPDNQSTFFDNKVGLGHARLSIIDTSADGHQPMSDSSGRFTIVYNGEFYNYKAEKSILVSKGVIFKSTSDTEVLLQMYMAYGKAFIKRVNGCFALAIYDKDNDILFIARDRFGIKPLYIKKTKEYLLFASEVKALMPFEDNKTLNTSALHQYFRFNYTPTHQTAIEGINKLNPGNYINITKNEIEEDRFYTIPYSKNYANISYADAKSKLFYLTENAVQKRLVSDVPIGTFLSGGIDSSVVSTLASRHKDKLNTFSVGYEDEPLFDETQYAELVAKKIKSNHHTFKLKNQDLFEHLFEFLDYFDEPFADSSALPVYILSKKTAQHVKVALSGDGADEVFSGYNKHLAHYYALYPGLKEKLIKNFGGVANWTSQSRNSKLGNLFRQISKYNKGLNMSDKERYLSWLSINNSAYADELLVKPVNDDARKEYENLLSQFIKTDFNDLLYSDVKFLLPNDMLTKVDKMSMANSLEVRTPFLDHEIVNFAFSLKSDFKIQANIKKRIVQDAFRDILPEELYNRPKHGFEVPLLNWFKKDLNDFIFKNLLEKTKIEKQNILNYKLIQKLEKQLNSNNPSDSVASIWAIIVFQYWYDKHFN